MEALEFSFNVSNCRTITNYNQENIVDKQRKRLRDDRVKEERKKASKQKRKKASQERQADREARKEQKEQLKEQRELLKSRIEELEELEFNENNQFPSNTEIDSLSSAYFNLSVLGKEVDKTEAAEQKLKGEIEALRLVIKNTQESLSGALLEAETLTDALRLYQRRVGLFVENKEKELEEKKEELKELQRTKRNERFPLTETLSSDNIKKLWDIASGPEPKEPSLFKKINMITGKDARQDRKDKYKRKNLTRTLLARLNPCNWESVLFDIIECLLGGMTLQEAIPIIIRTTLSKS